MMEEDFFSAGDQRCAYLFKQLNHLVTTAGLQWDDPNYLDPRSQVWHRIFEIVKESELERRTKIGNVDPNVRTPMDDVGEHARKLRQAIVDLAASPVQS